MFAEPFSMAYALLQYAIIYFFMAIFKERIKSSNSVSLGICSYKEVRMANNSPAAPTAEWSCESNFLEKSYSRIVFN